ncbi:MFS transporter [Yersinia sp. 2540 StPb PI]|uniref:MFS transporter n=1 Tax=Yersinia sp. 2540 StPb PI TaxID=3117406 RepID=UPI003FA4906B
MKIDAFMRLGPGFFLLQTGTTFSLFSGHVFRLALAWWCLKETNSAVAFSSLIAFSVAAEVYLKPFLASFGDQFHRIKFIVFCQLAVLTMIILFCLANTAGHFHIIAVTTGLIVMSAVVSVREPTIMGLIPDLVGEGEISRAISSRSAINSVIMLSGPVLAASLISLFSVGVALYVAAVLQGLSCLAFIVLAKKPVPASLALSGESWFSKTKGGFTAIYRVKSEFHIALISSVINFTMFPFFSVTVPFWISTELQLPASYLGAFEFSFALGLLAGSLYLNTAIRELVGRFWNVVSGFVLLGGSVIGIVMAPNIYVSIALAFFSGLAFIFINVNLSTLRSTATPGHYRTRMSAMAAFLSSLANPFGVVIAGWYIHWLGVTPFAVFSGIAVILVAPVLLWSWHLKKALSLEETEMKGYYEKTYPEAFSGRR